MSLNIGIIGLPNVGKSTLLNALTRAGAEASNYPFCTIEKNVGVTPVPDPDLVRLERILEPEEAVPTTVQFVDIAGLVAGASQGEGLGNQFLGHIREVDAVLHVVRCFEDENVAHVSGAPDPERDVQIVETELLLADLATAERHLENWGKLVRVGEAGKDEQAAFQRAKELLEAGTMISGTDLTDKELAILAEARFLTAKPSLFLANCGEDDPRGEGPLPTALKVLKGAERVVNAAVGIEEEIAQLPAAEQQEFLADLGLAETALNQVITSSYRLLGLITFYTIANNKLRAWQLPSGHTAPQAAGKIHSDMERGFIRAEVMPLIDLLRLGSRHALQEQGLIKTVGRDYVVQDRDVVQVHFKV
ncbi:MAG: redox-regulated ATPase YchF [bacterium]